MKKTLYFLGIIGIIFAFYGCRKGKEDPFISLMSRKARLTGTWQISGAQWTEEVYWDKGIPTLFPLPSSVYNHLGIQKDLEVQYYDYYYENNSLTEIDRNDNDTTIYSPYTYTITFNKDNTFELNVYSRTKNSDGYYSMDSYTLNGYWHFLSKTEEAKNKERVIMEVTKYFYSYKEQYGEDVYSDTATANISGSGWMNSDIVQVIDLLGLSNKTLKIRYNQSIEHVNGDYFKIYGWVSFKKIEK